MTPRPRSACRSDAKRALERVKSAADRLEAKIAEARAKADANRKVANNEVALEPKTADDYDEFNAAVRAIKAQKKLDRRVAALERRRAAVVARMSSAALKYHDLCRPGGRQ